jgi:hypothetical protein
VSRLSPNQPGRGLTHSIKTEERKIAIGMIVIYGLLGEIKG